MGIVDEPVHDGVGQSGVGQGRVPALHRELADDHGGADLAAIVDDLQEVPGLVALSRSDQEVVEGQELDLGQLGEQAGITAVAARQLQVGEQTRGAHVQGGVPAADGGLGEGQATNDLPLPVGPVINKL